MPARMWDEGIVVPTGNEELDMRLGGGIPLPVLLVIEGDHGTGKTVLTQQIIYGAVKSGFKVIYLTTELGVREFIIQSKRVSLDISSEFLKGLIKVIPLHMRNIDWNMLTSDRLLKIVSKYMAKNLKKYDIFVIDSLSMLIINSSLNSLLNFLTRVRTLVRYGKLIILTLHPSVIPNDVITRIRAVSDGYIKLGFTEIGGKLIKVMKVVKLRGAISAPDTSIAFDVDPAFGIKVVPLALAKA